MKVIIENLKKNILYALGSIALTTLVSSIFSIIKSISLVNTIFNANYIIGAVIVAVGTLGFFMPVRLKTLKKSKPLVDHSNIVDVLREEKELKISESLVHICWGICHIVLVGILEIIIKSII